MTSKLLPCPFCGGEAKRFTLQDEENFGGDVIACKSCDACSRVVFGEKEGLVEAWNRRATQPAAGEPIHQWADQDLWMDGDEVDLASARAEGFKTRTLWTSPPAAAHGHELVAVVGTVPDGSGFKSLDFKVELQGLPDGTRLYAAHGDEAVRKDAERYRWLESQVTEVALGGWSELYTDNRRAWKLPLLLSQNAVGVETSFGRAIDDAMRAQAGEGGD